MSGRLKISAKKSYCPFRADNLARVRRDEEAHRREQQLAKEKEQQQRRRRPLAGDVSGSLEETLEAPPTHVNLFAKEEQTAALLREDREGKRTLKRKTTGDEVPFYLKITSSNDATTEMRSQAQTSRLDPMSRYHTSKQDKIDEHRRENADNDDCSSSTSSSSSSSARRRKRRKKRKHEKSKRKQNQREKKRRNLTPDDNDASSSMQALRQKRVERERLEKERQQKLLLERQPADGYHNKFMLHK